LKTESGKRSAMNVDDVVEHAVGLRVEQKFLYDFGTS
jgi:hypothetical protein